MFIYVYIYMYISICIYMCEYVCIYILRPWRQGEGDADKEYGGSQIGCGEPWRNRFRIGLNLLGVVSLGFRVSGNGLGPAI